MPENWTFLQVLVCLFLYLFIFFFPRLYLPVLHRYLLIQNLSYMQHRLFIYFFLLEVYLLKIQVWLGSKNFKFTIICVPAKEKNYQSSSLNLRTIRSKIKWPELFTVFAFIPKLKIFINRDFKNILLMIWS